MKDHNLQTEAVLHDLLAGSGIPALAGLVGANGQGGATAKRRLTPVVDAGDPGSSLWFLLDTWAAMDEVNWTQDEVNALYDDILSFWTSYPGRAEAWWQEWRQAHPHARLR